MKPRDFFVVGMKVLGVWRLIKKKEDLRYVAEIYAGVLSRTVFPVASYWIHAGLDLVMGVYFLSGAPLLATWAYGPLMDSPACDKCGYSLAGNVSGVCPECGAKV